MPLKFEHQFYWKKKNCLRHFNSDGGYFFVFLVTKGLKPSVEFSGGETYTVKFKKSAKNEIEFIKTNFKRR